MGSVRDDPVCDTGNLASRDGGGFHNEWTEGINPPTAVQSKLGTWTPELMKHPSPTDTGLRPPGFGISPRSGLFLPRGVQTFSTVPDDPSRSFHSRRCTDGNFFYYMGMVHCEL